MPLTGLGAASVTLRPLRISDWLGRWQIRVRTVCAVCGLFAGHQVMVAQRFLLEAPWRRPRYRPISTRRMMGSITLSGSAVSIGNTTAV